MSITSELHRIAQAKADLKDSLEKRGVIIPENTKIDNYPDALDSCDYVVKGDFIPEEDTKTFSVGGLQFVPDSVSIVCPEECPTTANTAKNIVSAIIPKGSNGMITYRNSSGVISFANVAKGGSLAQWGADEFSITIPIDVYFKKGLVYKYVISGDNRDPNRHSQYFTITDDGELYLKPEYRGAISEDDSDNYPNSVSDNGVGVAGSFNSEIPSDLVIPEEVNGIAVDRLTTGMFMNNNAIEILTIPATIDEIPESFCNMAVSLKKVKNTEHIVKVGGSAFLGCRLEKVVMPNLEQIGTKSFGINPNLIYVDIGKVSTIEDHAFRNDIALVEVKSEGNVTSIGEGVFGNTWCLRKVDFINSLTSIGDYGFVRSGYDYDWGSRTDLSFGEKATSLQVNPTDFWSGLTPVPCENPLPTQLCQDDERWTDKEIGQTGYKYSQGCMLFSLIHAYSGITGESFDTVFDFENHINSIIPDLLNEFEPYYSDAATMLNRLGVNAVFYDNINDNHWNEESLAALYETLKNGGYALVSVQTGTNLGHAIVVYGVNEKKELLFLDSDRFYYYDNSKPAKGKLKIQQLIDSSRDFVIVSKE